MRISEANSLTCQLVHVGRGDLGPGIKTAYVTVAHVICKDINDIGKSFAHENCLLSLFKLMLSSRIVSSKLSILMQIRICAGIIRSVVRNETIVGEGKRFFDGIKKTFTLPYYKFGA